NLRDQVFAHVAENILRVESHGHERRTFDRITLDERLKFLFEYEGQLHSAVHFSEDNVDRSDASDQVGHQTAFRKFGQRLQIDEGGRAHLDAVRFRGAIAHRSEEHTSELQSRENLVCRLLLEKKKTHMNNYVIVV